MEKEYGITFTNFSKFCKFNQKIVFGDKIVDAGCALNTGDNCCKEACKVFIQPQPIKEQKRPANNKKKKRNTNYKNTRG